MNWIFTVAFVIICSGVIEAQTACNKFQPVAGRCDLSAAPATQAKCLLRPVKKFAHLGDPLPSLPAPLDALIGKPTEDTLTLDQLKRFLAAKGISETDLGGALSVKLTKPKYFVIHDTSDLFDRPDFPANINDESATINKLSRRVTKKICHVYINRAGNSATAVVFESTAPPSGTKFGTCNRSRRTEFLHIENVQPRIRDRSVGFPNDALAPDPGFPEAQLERLALVYLVASVRSGKWLIPAYHSPIDLGFRDRHDDPQNFNLQTWVTKLDQLIAEIRAAG
jgi:hypothetical protein